MKVSFCLYTSRIFMFEGFEYLFVPGRFFRGFPYHDLREWRQHNRHGYVTTYHRQLVTAAAVSLRSDGGSVLKVPVNAAQAMHLHSRPLFHVDAVIEELIQELLGKLPFSTPPLCRAFRWKPHLVRPKCCCLFACLRVDG